MEGFEDTGVEYSNEQKERETGTPLLDLSHWASIGDVKSVEYLLLKEGSEIIDEKDELGMTALMRAADKNKVEVIRLLAEKGASLDMIDSDGQTALHYATFCDHVEASQALVVAGASLEIKDNEGNTALDLATEEVREGLSEDALASVRNRPYCVVEEDCKDNLPSTRPDGLITSGFHWLQSLSTLDRVTLGVAVASMLWMTSRQIRRWWFRTV